MAISMKLSNVLENSLDFIERVNKNKKSIPNFKKLLKALSEEDYKTFFTECLFRIELLSKLKVFNYTNKDLKTIVDSIHRVTIYPIADALVAKYGDIHANATFDETDSLAIFKQPIDTKRLASICKKECADYIRLHPEPKYKISPKDFFLTAKATAECIMLDNKITQYETALDFENLHTGLYDISDEYTNGEFGGEYEDESAENGLQVAIIKSVEDYYDLKNTIPYKLYYGEDDDLNESEDIDCVVSEIMGEEFNDDTVIGYVPDDFDDFDDLNNLDESEVIDKNIPIKLTKIIDGKDKAQLISLAKKYYDEYVSKYPTLNDGNSERAFLDFDDFIKTWNNAITWKSFNDGHHPYPFLPIKSWKTTADYKQFFEKYFKETVYSKAYITHMSRTWNVDTKKGQKKLSVKFFQKLYSQIFNEFFGLDKDKKYMSYFSKIKP